METKTVDTKSNRGTKSNSDTKPTIVESKQPEIIVPAEPFNPFSPEPEMIRVNPEYFFWNPSYTVKEGSREYVEKNPLKGWIVGMGVRPWSNDPRKREKEERDGGPGNFYLFECTVPGTRVKTHNKNDGLRIAQVGDIIWVDERYDIRGLKHHLPQVDEGSGRVRCAFIALLVPKDKLTLSEGNTVWKIETYKRALFADQNVKMPALLNAAEVAWDNEQKSRELGNEAVNPNDPF